MFIKDKVIFIDKTSKKDKMFCFICNYPFLKKEDFDLCNTYSSCNECFLTFIEGRKEEWKNGWRPNPEKIKEYILFRKSIIKNNK